MSLEDPDFDFVNLVVTIGTTAQANLGEIPDFRTGKPKINLALARTNINMLAALKRKTEGRLSVKELKVLGDFIEDLQAKYMEALKSEDAPVLLRKAPSLLRPQSEPAASQGKLPSGPGKGEGADLQSRAAKLMDVIRQKRKEMGE